MQTQVPHEAVQRPAIAFGRQRHSKICLVNRYISLQNTAFDEGTVDSFFKVKHIRCFCDSLRGDFELTAGDGSRPAFDWISFCISHQRSLHIQTIDLQWPPSGIRIRQFLQAGKEEFKIFLHSRKVTLLFFNGLPFLPKCFQPFLQIPYQFGVSPVRLGSRQRIPQKPLV